MRWLKSLTSQSEPDTLRGSAIALFRHATSQDEYTLPEIAESLKQPQPNELLSVLAQLTKEQVVDQVFRVVSPVKRGGINDFTSLSDVPDRIFDWRQGCEVDVEPRMVRLLFKNIKKSHRLLMPKSAQSANEYR